MPKAAELIAADLRERIVRGKLAEGQALPPESELMAEFMVSRPTLREAQRILESEGLLSVRRGARGGARVHLPRAEVAARYAALVLQSRGVLLSDVYEARLLIEGGAASVLASRKSGANVRALRALLDEAKGCQDDLLELLACHHKFHNALVDLAGNETLTLLASMVDSILDSADFHHVEARQADGSEIRSLNRALRTHVKVVDLIEAHDAAGADKLWRRHLADSAGHVLADGENGTVLDVLT